MLRYVAAWLDAHRPPPAPLTLMHGDFQSANLLLSDDGEFVVLDWELAAVGDPREDMGYFKAVAQAAPPDLLDGERAERFCARYRALTGLDERQVNPVTIAYFLILGVVGTVRRLLEGGPRLRPRRQHAAGVGLQPELGRVRRWGVAAGDAPAGAGPGHDGRGGGGSLMYSRPTTEQILLGVARDLQEQVLPHVQRRAGAGRPGHDRPAAPGLRGAQRPRDRLGRGGDRADRRRGRGDGRPRRRRRPVRARRGAGGQPPPGRRARPLPPGQRRALGRARRRPTARATPPASRPCAPCSRTAPRASSRSSASSTSSAGGRRLAGARRPGRPRLVGGSGTRR